jgi:hypothetical protein
MKTVLFLGCSFSALYYHPDPRWSYTYQVFKELGFDKMINLSTGGGSPDSVNRILLDYLHNPVYGWPDFIFCQFPFAWRHEYYIDKEDHGHDQTDIIAHYQDFEKSCWNPNENVNLEDQTFDHLPWAQLKDEIATVPRTRMSYRKEKLSEFYDNITDHSCINVTNLQIGRESAETWKKHSEAHLRLYATWTQQSYNLHKEAGIFETICQRQNINNAYIETDNSMLIPEICKKNNPKAYDYFKLLCNKKRFIPGITMNNQSPYCVDEYKDGHPGRESHSKFAKDLIPVLQGMVT